MTVDERTREAERLSQVEGEPAARERWEAEQERLGRLKRIDLPFPFIARVEEPAWRALEDGRRSREASRQVLGPIGRPLRVPASARVGYEYHPGFPGSEALLEAARRGEVEGLIVEVEQVMADPRLAALPRLRLEVESDRPHWDADLEAIAGLRELSELSVFASDPPLPIEGELFADMGELESLELQTEDLADLSSRLTALGSLKRLKLGVLSDDVAALADWTGSALRQLALESPNDFDEEWEELFEVLPSLTQLESLSLDGVFPWAELAESVGHMSGLRELVVEGVDDRGTLSAAPLGSLRGLRRLSLWALRTEEAAPRLIEWPALPELRCLELFELSLDPASLRRLTGLRELRLYDWPGPLGAGFIAALGALPELRVCELPGWFAKPEVALQALARLPRLESLVLHGVRGQPGLSAALLLPLHEAPRLRELDVTTVPLEGAEALASLSERLWPLVSGPVAAAVEFEWRAQDANLEALGARLAAADDDTQRMALCEHMARTAGSAELIIAALRVAHRVAPTGWNTLSLVTELLGEGRPKEAWEVARRCPRLRLRLAQQAAQAAGDEAAARALASRAIADVGEWSFEGAGPELLREALERLEELRGLLRAERL